jgi:hypothetical protein
MKYNDFFNENIITFGNFVELQSTNPKEMTITQIFHIDSSEISKFGCALLSNDIPNGLKKMLSEISWAIRTYIEFQDIFDFSISLNHSENVENIDIYTRQICDINKNYCYYESISYLKEVFLCLLNGHLLASITLLRPFLELSVANIYWILKSSKESSTAFYKWLLGDKTYKQSFAKMIDYFFKNCDTLELLNRDGLIENQKFIKEIYRKLCSYNHTPILEESLISRAGNTGIISEDFFSDMIALISEMLFYINFIYLLNFPMTLFPQDIYRHFGYYGGPVGLFFDEFNYAILKRYFGEEEIMLLTNAFEKYTIKDDLLNFIEGYHKLNDEEMEHSWREFVSGVLKNEDFFKVSDHVLRVTLCKTHFRGFRISTSYIKNIDFERIWSSLD